MVDRSLNEAQAAISAKSGIVNRIQAALERSDIFKKADELKQVMENPTAYEGGYNWSSSEKNALKHGEADYRAIQFEKNRIKASLDRIASSFDEKARQLAMLSEDVQNIESKLSEIACHLRLYEEKLKLLQEKGGNKTAEDHAWEIKAREQMMKLTSDKDILSHSLFEIQTLKQDLNAAEATITRACPQFKAIN